MVRPLLSRLDLPQGHSCVLGGVVEHLLEVGVGHEVGAGAGGQVAASGEQLHGGGVDLPVALDGVAEGVAALGEGGGTRSHSRSKKRKEEKK